MMQLLFALAFSAAPLTLYVPPVRSFTLFVETIESFIRNILTHTLRAYPRIRVGCTRVIRSLIRR
ncbi:hypothetical protein AMTRI_Chr03g45360 [Amborella trichopoda]